MTPKKPVKKKAASGKVQAKKKAKKAAAPKVVFICYDGIHQRKIDSCLFRRVEVKNQKKPAKKAAGKKVHFYLCKSQYLQMLHLVFCNVGVEKVVRMKEIPDNGQLMICKENYYQNIHAIYSERSEKSLLHINNSVDKHGESILKDNKSCDEICPRARSCCV